MTKDEALRWFTLGATMFDRSAIMRKENVKEIFEIEWKKGEGDTDE